MKKIFNFNILIVLSCIVTISVSITSCKKFLHVDVNKSIVQSDLVFSNDVTAISAVTGIYQNMLAATSYSSGAVFSISGLSGQSADELYNYPQTIGLTEFDKNTLFPTNGNVLGLWQTMYRSIYEANAILKGIGTSTGMTQETKKQLEGEVKFVRALCHFYLVNLYADVPLILTTDYEQNAVASRTPVSTIYTQIVNDLVDAQNLLNSHYVALTNVTVSTADRVRPNKSTATALLARVYLYLGQWANAEAAATSIISNTAMYSLPTLDNTFLKTSTEAIWQLMPNNPTYNTFDGNYFIIQAIPQYNVITTNLLSGFESGDQRRVKWIGSFTSGANTWYFPNKYKLKTSPTTTTPPTEYSMVFRLAEQFLIRAEARAKQGNLIGANSAASDITAIRVRAGLLATTATTEPQIMAAIEQERRVELFTEWGHRWFDLKRWNRADAVLGPIKGANWQTTDVLYPLPQSEMDKNPNLKPQNPGY